MELIKKENHFQMLSKSVKEIDTETWKWLEIEWYASTKDKDRYWDIVEPQAFEKAMQTYALNPILLLQHDADKPIWKVESFTIDWNWLYIKAIVTEDIDWVMNKLKNGILKWFSIWYRLLDYEMNYTEDDEWNITDSTCVIKELELLEISLVSIPANPYALRKSIGDCFSSKSIEMNEEEKKETPVEEKNEEQVVENEEKTNSEGDTTGDEKAVEETEISDETNEEAEKVDEKPTTEKNETNLPEEKSFEVVRKEFSEQLEKKDVEIKAYAKKVDDLDSKLSETIKVLSSVVNAVKSIHDTVEKTVVQNSYQFQWPIVKDEAKDEIEKAVQFMKKQ